MQDHPAFPHTHPAIDPDAADSVTPYPGQPIASLFRSLPLAIIWRRDSPTRSLARPRPRLSTPSTGIILRVLFFCGLRPGELVALRLDDLEDNILRVDESSDGGHRYKKTKTKKTRWVVVPPRLLEDLKAELAKNDHPATEPMFTSYWGEMFTCNGLVSRLKSVVSLPGFNLRRLRTSFATYYNGDLADLAKLTGHADTQMTLKYYKMALPERMVEDVTELEERFSHKSSKDKIIVLKKKHL